jgi:Tfp pilus assembly protein PilN
MKILDPNIFSKIRQGILLEVYSGDEVNLCRILHYSRESGGLRILSMHECDLDNIHDEKLLHDALPIVLFINTKDILRRRTDETEIDKLDLFKKLLPGASEEDFIIQSLKVNSKTQLSLLRLQKAEEILELLDKEHEIPIVDMLISDYSEIERDDFEIKGDGNVLTKQASLNALYYYFKSEVGNESGISGLEEFQERRMRNKALQFFELSKIASLIFLFCLLLGNFFVQSSWNNELSGLIQEKQKNAQLLKNEQELRKKIIHQKNIITEAGYSNLHYYAWVSDQLASSIPDELILTDLILNPEKKKSRSSEVYFEKDKLRIKGECAEADEFNTWITMLDTMYWAKYVEVENYKLKKQRGIFSVLIEVNIDKIRSEFKSMEGGEHD